VSKCKRGGEGGWSRPGQPGDAGGDMVGKAQRRASKREMGDELEVGRFSSTEPVQTRLDKVLSDWWARGIFSNFIIRIKILKIILCE
jgi:hypothetical protein